MGRFMFFPLRSKGTCSSKCSFNTQLTQLQVTNLLAFVLFYSFVDVFQLRLHPCKHTRLYIRSPMIEFLKWIVCNKMCYICQCINNIIIIIQEIICAVQFNFWFFQYVEFSFLLNMEIIQSCNYKNLFPCLVFLHHKFTTNKLFTCYF